MAVPISRNYNDINLLQLKQRYQVSPKPVETTYPSPEEPVGVSYNNPFKGTTNTGLSLLVASAPRNKNGSRNVQQNVNSGFGRTGFTELSWIA